MEKVTLTREQQIAIENWIINSNHYGDIIARAFIAEFPFDEFAIITDMRKICPSCLNPVWDVMPEQKKKLVFTDDEGKEIDTTGMKFEFKVVENHCCDSCNDGHKCESE